MERKMCLITYFRVYPSQGQAEHDIHDMTEVENHLGKGKEIS